MPTPTYFAQECPTCGRTVEIRVAYLGKHVACRHCRGQFQAGESRSSEPNILERADQLLSLAEARSGVALPAPCGHWSGGGQLAAAG